ncbi:MAG: hypothetical protein EPO11_08990 [Gammaproteobacteria bacterium]|nr:MAG: hypothetical protein EPO11_08990 [Gammaproteobacteria bacterium]
MLRKDHPASFANSISHPLDEALNQIYGKRLELTFHERLALKNYIWHRLYQGIRRFYARQHNKYLKLVNHECKQENDMNDGQLIRYLIRDILETGEYTLEGIAAYVRVPLDVIVDIVSGVKTDPSFELSRGVIELHISVKRSYYHVLIRKLLHCLGIK